jgi:hypothetical protein
MILCFILICYREVDNGLKHFFQVLYRKFIIVDCFKMSLKMGVSFKPFSDKFVNLGVFMKRALSKMFSTFAVLIIHYSFMHNFDVPFEDFQLAQTFQHLAFLHNINKIRFWIHLWMIQVKKKKHEKTAWNFNFAFFSQHNYIKTVS